jgi:hypothetical protein
MHKGKNHAKIYPNMHRKHAKYMEQKTYNIRNICINARVLRISFPGCSIDAEEKL